MALEGFDIFTTFSKHLKKCCKPTVNNLQEREELRASLLDVINYFRKISEDEANFNLDNFNCSLFIEFILQEFSNTVMGSVPLTMNDPMMLSYFLLDTCKMKLTTPLIENSIIHTGIHQLRCLQLFLKYDEACLTIIICLLNTLMSCLMYSPQALQQALQFSLHHVLPFYTNLSYVNVSFLAKTTLAVLYNYKKLDDTYLSFFLLKPSAVDGLKQGLRKCFESKQYEVAIIDQRGGLPVKFQASDIVKFLTHLSKHPANRRLLMEPEFFSLLKKFLNSDLLELQTAVLKFLTALCSYHDMALIVCDKYSEILSKLEDLTFSSYDEMLQTQAASTAETIITSASMETAGLDIESEDTFPDDILSLLKVCINSVTLSLKSSTIRNITTIYKNDLKNKLGLVMTLLQLLLLMGKEKSAPIFAGCCKEMKECLSIICQYTQWLFVGLLKSDTDGDGFLKITPTHPLPLFHTLFYVMSRCGACDLLLDSGVLELMMEEIEGLCLMPVFNKGTCWFLYMSLAILANCVCELKDVFPSIIKYSSLKPLCLEEEFDIRLPAKILTSFVTKNKDLKVLTLLDSEAQILLQCLNQSAETENVSFLSPINSLITFTFNDLIQVLLRLLQSNPINSVVLAQDSTCYSTMCNVALCRPDSICQMNSLIRCILNHVTDDDELVKYLTMFPDCMETSLNASPLPTHDEVPYINNEVEFWLCNTLISLKKVLSVKDNDSLEECYKEQFQTSTGLVNMDNVAIKDRISGELLELFKCILGSQEGIDAFVASTSEIKSFLVALTKFVKLRHLGLVLDQRKVSVTTLVRLEYILLIIQYVCQCSEEFCMILGETGFIECLDEMVYALSVSELIAQSQQVTKQLNDLCIFILAVCAHVHKFQGYLWSLKFTGIELVRASFRMWLKCAQCAHEDSPDPKSYELSEEELGYLFSLISVAIEQETIMVNLWPLFTLRCCHSLLYLFKFCTRLSKCQTNIENFLKRDILQLLSSTCQTFEDTKLLQVTFQFLERIVTFPAVKQKLLSDHVDLITLLQVFNAKFPMETFFSLQSLEIETFNNTGISDVMLSGITLARQEEINTAITIFQSLLKVTQNQQERGQIMKELGRVSFRSYQEKRFIKDATSFADARQAASCLGTAYDEGLLEENDILQMNLDVSMMDVIFNVPNKPLTRCLLCRQKCASGEKIIHSHVWPESLLRCFAKISGNVPQSMKIFEASWKNFGYLQAPGQFSFYMLCGKCENMLSLLENSFKNNFFTKFYNDPNKPSTSTPEELVISLREHDNTDWLYRFCVSIIFRVMVVASRGCIHFQGNAPDLYRLFKDCRKILLSDKVSVCNIDGSKPNLALFFTPTHFMSEIDLPHSFNKILYSKGIGVLSSFDLYNGATSPQRQTDYILCSIGDINIVAAVNNSCFKFVQAKCRLIPGEKTFTIPSALERYLLFPNGLFSEFKSLATSQIRKAFHAPNAKISSKSPWASNEFQLLSKAFTTMPSINPFDAGAENETVHINLLPPPFNKIKNTSDLRAHVNNKCQILLHFFDPEETLSNSFLIKVTCADFSYQLKVFFRIEANNYNIWIGYQMSLDDLSIVEPLYFSEEKAELFAQIEQSLQVRERICSFVQAAVKNAGFCHVSHLTFWITNGIDALCDMKCRVACAYCLSFCCVCFKPEISLQIEIDDVISATCVCSQECANYIDNKPFTDRNIETNVKVLSTPCGLKDMNCVLCFCTNGVLVGFSKCKCTVFLFDNSTGDHFIILCQVRGSFHQKITLFTASYEFEFKEAYRQHNDMSEESFDFPQEQNTNELLLLIKEIYEKQKPVIENRTATIQ